MSKELTCKQANVLIFIKKYIADKKYPPSCRNIADHFGVNTKTAHDYLLVLEKKNFIRREKSSARAMEVL